MSSSSPDPNAEMDPLTELLADLAREDMETDDEFEPLWRKMATGTLTAAEKIEIEAMAADSAEAGYLAEACRPLGQDFQARVLAAIQQQALADRAAREKVEARRPASRRPGLWPARWSDWSLRWTVAGFGALAAAAIALLLLRPAALAPLPELDIARRDIVGIRGGEPAGEIRLEPQRGLALTLAPAVDGPLALRAFLLKDGERVPALFAYQGQAVALGEGQNLAAGAYDLVVLAGRPDALEDPEALLAAYRQGASQGEGWQVLHQRFQVVETE